MINNPFVDKQLPNAIKIDNPLDSNKKYLRLSTRESLLNNLLYNERRQKDSIKLFENFKYILISKQRFKVQKF